jgi:hypothetical protein
MGTKVPNKKVRNKSKYVGQNEGMREISAAGAYVDTSRKKFLSQRTDWLRD